MNRILDVIAYRPKNKLTLLLLKLILSKISQQHHYNGEMIFINSTFGSQHFLTSLKIWNQRLCCSNHHHSHPAVCHIFHITILKLCTIMQVTTRNLMQFQNNKDICSNLECIGRPHQNICRNCCQQHRIFVQEVDLFPTMLCVCQNLRLMQIFFFIILFFCFTLN